MIRAMLWKEWREQRTIALAVLAFGVAALIVTVQLADSFGNFTGSPSTNVSLSFVGAGTLTGVADSDQADASRLVLAGTVDPLASSVGFCRAFLSLPSRSRVAG